MIPKKIHYCWFGRGEKPKLAKKCIESWKIFFPGYKIIQWNEKNFDITKIDFMKKAYEDKKWAFVSDVVRALVVYEYGGLYFDADVEIVHSYMDILTDDVEAFLGFENDGYVNSGLGFGAVKGHPFFKKLIEEYEKLDYEQYKGRISDVACPIITTNLLMQEGLIKEDRKQIVSGVTIYPTSYFAPRNYRTGKIKKTDLMHSIHWYNASWQDENKKQEQERLRKLSSIVGIKTAEILYGITSCIKNEGLNQYIKKRIGKLFFRKRK